MQVERLAIPDVLVLTPKVFRDERGFFSECYSQRTLAEVGIADAFVQDNHALSRAKGVVRGLHLQAPPVPQGKLVRVVRGAIFDVAVDVRHGSATFGRWVSATLTADNFKQIWVPPGFLHGYATLEPDTEVIYKVTNYYAPECDRGVMWNDPALGIAWPIDPGEAILSGKDQSNRPLVEHPVYFRNQA
ncbi:MAG: dTDP-4-dehydrorhamnose 3,5-epimerase [Hyphomicrobiaceae bacterium]|nr:dTDP-4-dehydrorhamnose 3,5-epimerase [Hyphomicrobiaceae bacterium]